MQKTAGRIETELGVDGGGHRYAGDSYYGGGEWQLLPAYPGWYYVKRGEQDRAGASLDRGQARPEARSSSCPSRRRSISTIRPWPGVRRVRWGDLAYPLHWSHGGNITLALHLAAPSAPTGRRALVFPE